MKIAFYRCKIKYVFRQFCYPAKIFLSHLTPVRCWIFLICRVQSAATMKNFTLYLWENCVVMEWCMTCHICFFLPKPDWAILHKPSIIRRQKQQENLRRPPYRHQPPWCQDIPQQISRYAKWIWLGPTKGKWQEDEHATRYHWFKWRVVERS